MPDTKQYPETRIKEVYSQLFELALEGLSLSNDKKSIEDDMKGKIANIKGYFEKDGKTPQLSKVKGGLLTKAIEVHVDKVNKLEEDIAIMEEYLALIKSKDIPKSMIDRFSLLKSDIKELNGDIGDINKSAKNDLDPEVHDAIKEIVKSDIEKIKKDQTEDTGEDTKPIKSPDFMKKFFTLVTDIKSIIKK